MALSDNVAGSLPVSVVGGAGLTTTSSGAAAHDAAVSGNPVLVGYEARTALGTAVTNGDAVRAAGDKHGRSIVGLAPPDNFVEGRTNLTNTTGADLIAAPGAGLRLVIMSYSVINHSPTQATKVSLRSTTTARRIIPCAINGGGANLAGAFPLLKCATNEPFNVIAADNADVEVSASGYIEPA